MIIIDRTMLQCGIRWRGTCNRKLVKKADNLQNFIEKGKRETSLIRYVPGLVLPLYQDQDQDQDQDQYQYQSMIEKRAFADDNYKNLKTSNAKRLW